MVTKLELADGYVLLRPYRLSDIERFYEAACESIPEVSVWMSWCYTGYSIKDCREWVGTRAEAWEKETSFDFTIVNPEDDSYLGGCGLNNISHGNKFANLGYWVRTGRTRRGVATAATRLLARFGFEELKLNRIEIVVATPNIASQRVAEKAGATREGVSRNRLVVGDRVYDAVMFSLIPHDLP